MGSKHYIPGLVLRIIFLLLAVFLTGTAFAWLGKRDLLFLPIVAFLITTILVTELVLYLQRISREISRFVSNMDQQDLSEKFDEMQVGRPFRELYRSFNRMITQLESIKLEKEAQFAYLRVILGTVRTGILSVREDGSIALINEYAEDLLGISGDSSWKVLERAHPALASEIDEIRGQGNRLVETRIGDEQRLLSVNLSTARILDTVYRVITIKDIRTEIEQKEIEAWHKLIQILRHEIRNSVTPIASMSETILMLLEDQEGKTRDLSTIQDSDLADLHSGARTIYDRSERLFEFVEKYRRLTKLPSPSLETIQVRELLGRIMDMFKKEAETKGISFVILNQKTDIRIEADPGMMEQVLINLIRNSIQALHGRENGRISLSAGITGSRVLVSVEDNGPGLLPESMEDIFLPFYSTKDEGMGIGLSLSRQIMNLHGGTITVESRPDDKTIFSLVFNQAFSEVK